MDRQIEKKGTKREQVRSSQVRFCDLARCQSILALSAGKSREKSEHYHETVHSIAALLDIVSKHPRGLMRLEATSAAHMRMFKDEQSNAGSQIYSYCIDHLISFDAPF